MSLLRRMDSETTEVSRRKGGRFSKKSKIDRTRKALEGFERKHAETCAVTENENDSDESAAPCPKNTQHFSLTGRRVFHMPALHAQLSQCRNPSSDSALHVIDCTSETKYGYASILSIPCRQCAFVNRVHTDTHQEASGPNSRGLKPFTINRKAALGKFVNTCNYNSHFSARRNLFTLNLGG